MQGIVTYTEQDNQFYPTPKSLLEKIDEDFKEEIASFHAEHVYDIKVLEPSAGKGDIATYLKKSWGHSWARTPRAEVECIECDPNLRAILKDKNFPVIYDNFLDFHSYTHYDLIFMNPPFADADKHLLKAISIQEKSGGKILCIMNAETLRNPFTRQRAELAKKISDLQGKVVYYTDAFNADDSERKTSVEIAVVWLDVLAPESLFNSKVFEELDKAQELHEEAPDTEERQALIRCGMEWVKAMVAQYNEQATAGISFFKEYAAFTAQYNARYHAIGGDAWKYSQPFSLQIYGDKCDNINRYLEITRRAYWKELFAHPLFCGKLTNRLRDELNSRLDSFSAYDFCEKNILLLMEENMMATVRGIEQAILDLFDEFTKHAQYDGCDNIHYYNGWKTNSAHRLNSKIIIPFYAAWRSEPRYSGTSIYSMRKTGYDYKLDVDATYRVLSDMSKTLNYLSSGVGEIQSMDLLLHDLEDHFNAGNAKNIETTHFILTFYKKGTCHIKFKNPELLEKFNLFASQRKGWLPPCYGTKHYDDMSHEEQTVIDEFQGKDRYEQILQSKTAYIVENTQLMMLASGKED